MNFILLTETVVAVGFFSGKIQMWVYRQRLVDFLKSLIKQENVAYLLNWVDVQIREISNRYQRHIQKSVKHLRWSSFNKNTIKILK